MTDPETRHPSLEGTEIRDSVLDLIGYTGLLALDRINELGSGCLFVKCEFLIPVAI